MSYRISTARLLHVPAFVRKGKYLTKCGMTLTERSRVVYTSGEVTCTGCRHRPNWPDSKVQKAFDRL